MKLKWPALLFVLLMSSNAMADYYEISRRGDMFVFQNTTPMYLELKANIGSCGIRICIGPQGNRSVKWTKGPKRIEVVEIKASDSKYLTREAQRNWGESTRSSTPEPVKDSAGSAPDCTPAF